MITIKHPVDLPDTYPLDRIGPLKDLLFFDIETTGFSGDTSQLYLIGCTYHDGFGWKLIQWFADSRESERELLTAFFTFMERFKILVHFNGDGFDIPYLLKCCRRLDLPYNFDRIKSVDIYKKIKPYRKLLGLENMKQKSIEQFLGLAREDKYNGGQLIEVYREYLMTHESFLYDLLILHNEDDLKGMPSLLPVLFYPDFFAQDFTLDAVREAPGETDRLILSLSGDPVTILPSPVAASVPAYAFRADKDRMELSIRVYKGTLKYYYPNYKDYYYLIYEDTAIHKSVGEFVDKDARIKATKETCYTKKDGTFLPQPADIWVPEFKTSCKDKTGFFEVREDCFSDAEKLNRYIKEIFSFLK